MISEIVRISLLQNVAKLKLPETRPSFTNAFAHG